MSDVAPLPELLDVDRVAEYLGVSTATVGREIRSGRLPCIRVGRKLRFTHEHVRRYLQQLEGGGCTGSGGTGSVATDTARIAARGSTERRDKLDGLRSASRILTQQ